MNEKIKELKERATILVENDWGSIYPESNEEKFAELIIRECISVLNHRISVGKPDVVLDEEVHSCIRDIKEHFGVE